MSEGFSANRAALQLGHIALSSDLPYPLGNGFHNLPDAAREAVCFTAKIGVGRTKEFWEEQI